MKNDRSGKKSKNSCWINSKNIMMEDIYNKTGSHRPQGNRFKAANSSNMHDSTT